MFSLFLQASEDAALTDLAARLAVADSRVAAHSASLAARLGLPMRGTNANGDFQLAGWEVGPVYRQTCNLGTAKTIGADLVWPNGGAGYSLTGAGLKVGVWDSGPVFAHSELTGRVTVIDNGQPVSGHATHVAGTIAATGADPNAKGMAYQGLIDSRDWNNDLAELAAAAAAGLTLSSHSYTAVCGWSNNYFGDGKWAWFGDPAISQTSDWKFGFYDATARDLDSVCRTASRLLPVVAAGNDRSDTGPVPGTPYWLVTNVKVLSTDVRNKDGGTLGYDSLPMGMQTAKNPLCVGGCAKIPNRYGKPGDVVLGPYSSSGPTDDGRIKPDLVAPGTGVYSIFEDQRYGELTGTSSSAPTVAGGLSLVRQRYRQTHGNADPRGATLKALAVHAAREAGPYEGPDYRFGYGLFDAAAAARLATFDQQVTNTVLEGTLTQGGVFTTQIQCDGDQPVKATLVWMDEAGPVPPVRLNPATRILVNDLDLRIVKGASIALPWTLDPAAPGRAAVRADNWRDNVEQVVFPTRPEGVYTIRVTHKRTLTRAQPFSLVVTGANPPLALAAKPNRVKGGSPNVVTATVDVGIPASKGLVLKLTSDNAAAKVPATVVVPAGATRATFTIDHSAVTVDQVVKISALGSGVTRQVTLTLVK
ncbi:MAG: S8 family serine peptidase [Fimbriimonadaceae bacterium]|nr:S8 family serine peptidase [Fimbriimonadaceae bacterium]QYK55440.1 MAG: S8 family serine peptidase [Fimbriimonadaceae bacterium]